MNSLEELRSVVVQALMVVVPLAATAVAGWLRSKIRRDMAREAALEVEQEAESKTYLHGRTKMHMAVERVRKKSGMFTAMNPEQTAKVIESVLPEVRKERNSKRPSRPGRVEADLPKGPRG